MTFLMSPNVTLTFFIYFLIINHWMRTADIITDLNTHEEPTGITEVEMCVCWSLRDADVIRWEAPDRGRAWWRRVWRRASGASIRWRGHVSETRREPRRLRRRDWRLLPIRNFEESEDELREEVSDSMRNLLIITQEEDEPTRADGPAQETREEATSSVEEVTDESVFQLPFTAHDDHQKNTAEWRDFLFSFVPHSCASKWEQAFNSLAFNISASWMFLYSHTTAQKSGII